MTPDSPAAHLRARIAAAPLVIDPGPHMVVPDLLPADLYALLLETMPPPDGFDIADKLKASFDPARSTIAPARSRETWMSFHTDILDALLTPILLDRFRPHLISSYQALFGPDLAEDALRLRHHAFRGRLMLRRPGYRLQPVHAVRVPVLRRAAKVRSRAPRPPRMPVDQQAAWRKGMAAAAAEGY